MRYRVEQLAAECDVSVDTIRYYQARRLVPPPEREGRVAWYDERHVRRIREVRALRGKGLTLAAIGRVLDEGLDGPDADLAAAVAIARGEVGPEELLPLDEFANRSGVPASLIQAVEREGIRLGRTIDGEERYTAADIDVVRGALRLLEYGLPLGELLALAAETNEAMQHLSARAVELFDRHVREPIIDTSGSPELAATQLVEAFDVLLPTVTNLIANHFRRVLLVEAERRFG